MSGLLVSVGQPLGRARWESFLRELQGLGGDGTDSWHDAHGAHGAIAMGRAYRCEASDRREPPIVRHKECTVILDGWLKPGPSGSNAWQTDSERVADAYREYGDNCARTLDGEFAFLLWDGRRKRLLGGCDVMGHRTFAYHARGSSFLASTRAIALLAHPDISRAIEPEYIAQLLCNLWNYAPGRTPFRDLSRLRPGFGLLFEDGRLTLRRVDRLRLDPAGPADRTGAAYEEFWSILAANVRTRRRNGGRPSLLLSGGLDSACVANVLADVDGGLNAFSIVAPGGSESVQQAAISAVLQPLPSVVWCPIAPEPPAAVLDELASGIALADDPVVAAPGLLPTRRLAWQMMARAGFRSAFDGEGGDELFDLAPRIGDLVQVRAWRDAFQAVRGSGVRTGRAILWRSIAVPRLPRAFLQAWIRREVRRMLPVPPWVSADRECGLHLGRTYEKEEEWLRHRTFGSYLPAMLENGSTVGSACANRLLRSVAGVEGASPFFDRTMAEFAARIPVNMRLGAERKTFLKLASEGRVPDTIRRHRKNERLHARLLVEAISSPRAVELAALAADVGPLGAWISLPAIERAVGEARAGVLAPGLQARLYGLLAFAAWWLRVDGYAKAAAADG